MSAVLSIIAGFASALGGGLWDLMAVIGCIITISVALLVLWCVVATHGQRREPLRVVITGHAETGDAELGDDTIAMLRGPTEPIDTVDAEIAQWLREG